ncbi:MAG: porin, partial [Alphaproteobacteria bacterium]
MGALNTFGYVLAHERDCADVAVASVRYGTAFGDLTLGDVAGNFNPDGNDLIRYDSPSIYGFVLSASWGDSDYADATLKFEKEFKTLKIVAAIAYIWDNQNDGGDGNEQLGGSISVMHLPTGLYAAFQAASRDYESTDTPDSSFWYVQGGIEKRWMALGATTLYGEYGRYDDFSVEGAETTRWGFGVNQKIEGYYDTCMIDGLTGEQGVLIPKQNEQDLMLKDEVIEAVRE